jgi:hypothetical protein
MKINFLFPSLIIVVLCLFKIKIQKEIEIEVEVKEEIKSKRERERKKEKEKERVLIKKNRIKEIIKPKRRSYKYVLMMIRQESPEMYKS